MFGNIEAILNSNCFGRVETNNIYLNYRSASYEPEVKGILLWEISTSEWTTLHPKTLGPWDEWWRHSQIREDSNVKHHKALLSTRGWSPVRTLTLQYRQYMVFLFCFSFTFSLFFFSLCILTFRLWQVRLWTVNYIIWE